MAVTRGCYGFMGSFTTSCSPKSGQQTTYKQCDVHYFENIPSIFANSSSCRSKWQCHSVAFYCRGVQDVERFKWPTDGAQIAHGASRRRALWLCRRSLKQSDYFIVMTALGVEPDIMKLRKIVLPTLKKQVLPESYTSAMVGLFSEEFMGSRSCLVMTHSCQ